MKHFPIFIAPEGRRVVLSGGGDAALGPLARAARGFRSLADGLPMGRVRRAFWSGFFFRADLPLQIIPGITPAPNLYPLEETA